MAQLVMENLKFSDLARKLECSVSYKGDNYLIRNDKFDITAWDETIEKAEEAFVFCFHSLYTNFAIENDNSLSYQAIGLKKRLNTLVKSMLLKAGPKDRLIQKE